MNLAETAKMVHENAVAHGWWETERDYHELLALIHSEWSEALEEYRADRKMVWFHCCECDPDGVGLPCDPKGEYDCLNFHMMDKCDKRGKKPEGIAVELVDGCIRILDFLGHDGYFERVASIEVEGWNIKTVDALIEKVPDVYNDAPLPEIVCWLHYFTSAAVDPMYNAKVLMTEDMKLVVRNEMCTSLLEAFGIAAKWLEHHDIDFASVLELKHNYNVSRPYRHGGKVC